MCACPNNNIYLRNNHSSLLNLDLIYSLFIRSCIYDACIHAYYCKLVVIFYNMSMLEFWKFTISIWLENYTIKFTTSPNRKNAVYFGKITTSDPQIPRNLLVYNKITLPHHLTAACIIPCDFIILSNDAYI
jgi:hypothetical protein